MGPTAVIVFTDTNDHWTAKYLHEVNHCLICYAASGHWVVIDYTFDGLRVEVSTKLPKGLYYQKCMIESFSLMPFFPTCVGYVKRAAGIKNPAVLTPWQLLKYMRRQNGRQSEETKGDSRRKRSIEAAIKRT